jgi:hypothetical protein
MVTNRWSVDHSKLSLWPVATARGTDGNGGDKPLCLLLIDTFTLHPYLTIREDFLFPDGDSAFEFADGPFAGLKSCPPVRSADRDDNACLANLEAASTVNYPKMRNFETLVSLAAESFKFPLGHRRVCLIDEI